MQSGNGIDLAAIHQLLMELVEIVRGQGNRLDAIDGRLDGHTGKLNELIVALNEHRRRFAEVAGVLNDHSRELAELIEGLRDLRGTVAHYHHSVVGHGIAVNRLEERVTMIEGRLDLGPP